MHVEAEFHRLVVELTQAVDRFAVAAAPIGAAASALVAAYVAAAPIGAAASALIAAYPALFRPAPASRGRS